MTETPEKSALLQALAICIAHRYGLEEALEDLDRRTLSAENLAQLT